MVILYFALNLVSNALSFDNCYCKTFSDVGDLFVTNALIF